MTSALTQAAEAHRKALLARQALDAAAARRNDAVRAAAAAGHSAPEIAKALGVNRQRVYQMLSTNVAVAQQAAHERFNINQHEGDNGANDHLDN